MNCKKLKPRVFTFSLRSTPLEQFDIIHQYVGISTHVLCQYLLPRTTSFHKCFDIFKGLSSTSHCAKRARDINRNIDSQIFLNLTSINFLNLFPLWYWGPTGVLLRKLALKMKHLPYKSNAEIQLNGRQLRAENFKESL